MSTRLLLVALLAILFFLTATAIAATIPNTEFVYVADAASGTISAFRLSTATGALTKVTGSPFHSGVGPGPLVASPQGTFLYAVMTEQTPGVRGSNCNDFNAEVHVYAINRSSGALTQVQILTMPGFCAFGVTISPEGNSLYVAMSSPDGSTGLIGEYHINATSGKLSAVSGSPVRVDSSGLLSGVLVHPTGKFVYASSFASNGLLIFDRSLTTGALTFRRSIPMQVQNSWVISFRGYFLLSIPQGNFVNVFSINQTTGVPTRVPGSPFAAPSAPRGMDINSTSTRVAITTAGGVTTYTKSPSGRLTPVAGSPFPTGGNYPSDVKFDRLNRFIFVINYQSNNVTVFRVGTTGALTKTAGSPYATGRAPSTVIVVK